MGIDHAREEEFARLEKTWLNILELLRQVFYNESIRMVFIFPKECDCAIWSDAQGSIVDDLKVLERCAVYHTSSKDLERSLLRCSRLSVIFDYHLGVVGNNHRLHKSSKLRLSINACLSDRICGGARLPDIARDSSGKVALCIAS